jgi:glycosyltransferase involved in cell wall biosynthesis
MASWPLALAARLRSRRARIALSAHGTDVSFSLRGGVLGRLYGLYLALGARLLPGVVVIANSEATANSVRKGGFQNVAEVSLATDIRAAPPAGKHCGRVLFVGRMIPRKGCAWFIRRVLPLLPNEITMRVAGTVWDADEAAAMNDPRVDFLGPVHGEALIEEYASALCVIVPNIDVPNGEFEGFGLTATETAAAGGIALAAAHSGLMEALVDGETGFHLPSGDAEKWASMICEIRDWPDEKREKFIQKAVETTRRIYSWDRVARETIAAYALAR